MNTATRTRHRVMRAVPKYDKCITETLQAVEDCRLGNNLVELDLSSLEAFRESIMAD